MDHGEQSATNESAGSKSDWTRPDTSILLDFVADLRYFGEQSPTTSTTFACEGSKVKSLRLAWQTHYVKPAGKHLRRVNHLKALLQNLNPGVVHPKHSAGLLTIIQKSMLRGPLLLTLKLQL